MKRTTFFMVICLIAATAVRSQKWSDLSDEQKEMKLKSFRDANQKYLKDSLHLTQTQMTDLDNVNVCFLSTLDRIDRYVKSDEDKEKYADAVWNARWAQVDAIMGKDKHEQYAAYMKRKIEAAKAKMK